MKKFLKIAIPVIILILVVVFWWRYYFVFGEGVKAGNLNFVVKKGYIFKKFTFPTGNEVCGLFRRIPNNEPAAITYASLASSAKYFKLDKALGDNCISSKKIKVLFFIIGFSR